MEDLAKKASAILVVYLFVSLEFGYPFLSFRDVSAQAHDSYEEFLRKLGDYFEEAAPPESAPIDECEYTIPEGLDPYVAERIWKELGALVSLGRPPEDLSNYLKEKNFTLLSLKVNGTEAKLNFSGLSVVRGEDGSVRVKVPVVSNETLDYMSYNSTDVRKLYRVWNETSLRYYRVSRISGYTLTYLDLESGESYSVNSELAVSEFPRGGLMDLLPAERLEVEELNWGTIAKSSGTPVIAVPGHYEEVKVVVPEQRANFKVLFPAYDPAVYEGWLINTAISSTSVTAGQSFTVSYSAYPEGVDPEQVPLQARVSVSVPSAIQLIGSGSAQLDNSHRSGSFSLKALRAGTYDVTLRVEGNALFYSLPPSGEIRYTVQVTTPTSPSVSVSITDVDTSVPKYARLKVKLQNNGGSAARSLTLKVSGDVEEASWSVGDLAPGQSSERELNVKLKEQEADIAIEASYLDDGGNRFLSKAWRQVFSLHFVVPEHYEDYVVTIPEHEETTTVFVPGYEGYTHVRFYAAYSFAVGNPNIYGPTAALFFPGIVLDVPTLFYEFFGTKITRGETLSLLRTYLIPLPLPGLELSVSKDGNFSQPEGVDVNFMLTGVEPRWEEVGLLEEGEAARAGNLTREQIRSGDTPDTFRAEFVKEVWVPSRKAVMNLSEFVKFRFAMESYIAENSLANELRYRWEEFVNATRIYAKSKEGGFAVFVYHPLTVRGSGALKSVQVKNYAACNASYELRVVRRSMPAAGFGVPALEEVMNTTSIEVPGTGDLSLFASSLAREGYQLRAQLVYGCRVVAEVVFDLQPELSPFWAGFWDGAKEKLPGIIITTAILVVLAIPTGGGSILAEVKALLTSSVIPTLIGASVAAEVMELVDAYWAYERMGKVAEELDEFSRKATENGYAESASFFRGIGDRVREDRLLIAESTALDLLADLTARDLFVVFGREDTTEYERGKAWGRVVGVALSFMLYAGTYYKLFAEGPKLLSWKGKIKEFLRGVYNWITPPIFDVGVMIGKFAAHEVAASLAMSERSEEFREQLNLLRDEEDSLSSLVRYTGDYLDKALEISETLDLSERAFLGLLWAYGNTVRDLGEGDWEGFIENVRNIGGGSKRFADEYLRWIYNAEVSELDEIILETTPKLAGLSAEELENIGKALAAKGLGDSFENGLKLLNTYFQIPNSYGSFGTKAVEKISNVFLENVGKDGVKALDAWSRAVENGGIALRTKVGGTPYPRFWKDLWNALRLKEGDTFTIVVDYDGEECRIPAEAKDVSGDHVLSPFRRGSFALLQGGEYVEAYPGLSDPSLFMEVESEEGATYVFAKDNWFEKRYVEEHGGEGLQIIMYKKVGSSFGEHYIMRDVHLEEVKTPAIYFKPYDGPGIYKIEFVKKVEMKDLCGHVENLEGDYQLAFDESSGKFRLMLFRIPLESVISKYEETIGKAEERVGGYEIIFPIQTEEKTWALALLFSVDPKNGELTSKLNFAYNLENPAWRHVTGLETYDVDGDKVFQITFELADHDQTARIRWDESLEKFTSYKVRPGSLLKSIMREFLSKDYFSEPQLEGDATKGSMTMRVVKNIREYLTWYNDAAYGFGDHAQGVAGNMVGDAFFLKKFKDRFGIQGELIIDETGRNLGDNIFDEFSKEGKKILWCSEWKSTYSEETDLSSRLTEAKTELMKRVNLVKNKVELLEYGYAFAIRITESHVEILWERVKIP